MSLGQHKNMMFLGQQRIFHYFYYYYYYYYIVKYYSLSYTRYYCYDYLNTVIDVCLLDE